MDLERVFGPLALELNPAALGLSESLGEGVVLEVSYALEALRPRARKHLTEVAGARFGSAAGLRRERLRAALAGLAEAAAGCPEAGVLLEAGKGLERRLDPPEIMGVINVTPDSFSDGGLFVDPALALEHGSQLVAAGATILDVGGESTRPGARAVDAEEETRRVLPVVRGLAAQGDARISIDTTKASVARAALEAGAEIVNDVSGGEADPEMLSLVAETGCDYVLMHARGKPADMQVDPRYDDAPTEVLGYLRTRVADCLRRGIEATKIVVDPGIGFGKRLEHNTSLLQRLPELRSLGRPLLVGVSRKSFIGHITGEEQPDDWRARKDSPRASAAAPPENGRASRRLGGTAAAVTVSVLGGAEMLRVHDVAEMAEATRVAAALRAAGPAPSTPSPRA